MIHRWVHHHHVVGIGLRCTTPEWCCGVQILCNKALCWGGQFEVQSSIGLHALTSSIYNLHTYHITDMLLQLVFSKWIPMVQEADWCCILLWKHNSCICKCTFCRYTVLTACVWFLFQGGPGTRGGRGDRGEPGLTVCIMQHLCTLGFQIPSIFFLLQVIFDDLR